jgi:hypothetical protein
MTERCDIGGTRRYFQIPGPMGYVEPCGNPPTHRYHAEAFAPSYWGYRCAEHVGWLDASRCTLEPLAGAR